VEIARPPEVATIYGEWESTFFFTYNHVFKPAGK